MAKVSFTAARVAAFGCEPGKRQTIHWDADTPGLGLRVTEGGARAYIFESRLHGRTLRVTIGTAHAWPLKKARVEAARLRVLVDAGTDPREREAENRAAAEAKRKAAQRDDVTVREVWAAYLEHLRTAISPKTKKPRSARYLADHGALASPGGEPRKRAKKGTKTTAGPLASLMDLRLAELTAQRVAAWLEVETAQRPTNAAHAYRLLKAFIRWSAGHDDYAGIVGADAWQSPKVTGLVPQSKAKVGGTLQREQLKSWFAAVRGLDNTVASAYLQATLICGTRREEMAALKWTDVNFRWGSLHVRDKVETLTGRDIPLPPYLASILAALPRRNEWVFSSPTAEDGKIAEPRFSHNRALAVAGLPHLTIQDLRRSCASLSEWCEVPAGVMAQIQGHKPSGTREKHYVQRPLDLLRVWHTKVEAWLLEQAGIEFKPEEVKAAGLHAVK